MNDQVRALMEPNVRTSAAIVPQSSGSVTDLWIQCNLAAIEGMM